MGKKKKKIKKSKPEKKRIYEVHIKEWWIFIGFALITIILYFPILSPAKMLAGDDQLIAGYIFRDFLKKEIASGDFPFWNPFIFSGLPFIDAIHGDTFYISTLLRLLFPAHYVVSLLFIIHTFLAAIGMFLFLRSEGLKKSVAAFGGASYMLTGLLVSQANAGHDGRMIVISLFPWLFYLISMGMKKEKFLYFILSSIVIGLALLSPHVQLSYYMLMAAFFYFVFEVAFNFKERGYLKSLKLFLYFAIGVIVGISMAGVQFLPSLTYVKYSPRLSRGYSFATQFSMPPFELLDQITPYFSGIKEHYWGWYVFKQHTEYTGIIVFILAIFGIIKYIKRKKIITFASIFSIGTLLAFGKYLPFGLYRIPYTIIPFLSKLRAPNMFFSISVFSLVVLASFTLDFMIREKKIDKKFIYLPVIITILWLSVIIFKSGYLSLFSSYIRAAYENQGILQQKIEILEANMPYLQKGLFWAMLLSWFTFLLLYFKEERLGINLSILLLTLLVIVDLFLVDRKFIEVTDGPDIYYRKDGVVNTLKQDNSLYRVFPVLYRDNDCYLMYHEIQSIGGYHGNQLGDYQKFIGAPHTIMFRDYTNLYYKNFVDLLNVKYIVAPELPQDLSSYPYYVVNRIMAIKRIIEPYEKMGRVGDYAIYRNEPMPRVLPLFKARYAQREEILEILKTDFNIREIALLEKGVEPPLLDSTGQGYAKVVSYSPNRIEVEVEVTKPALIFFSELYYPRWRAKVDGKDTKIYRVDYIFRGVPVESGKHRIVMYFSPSIFIIGMTISILSLLFIIGSVIGYFIIRRRR